MGVEGSNNSNNTLRMLEVNEFTSSLVWPELEEVQVEVIGNRPFPIVLVTDIRTTYATLESFRNILDVCTLLKLQYIP